MNKQEKLSRIATYLVDKDVSITDSSGWLQADNEKVLGYRGVSDGEMILDFATGWVRYVVGQGQHIVIHK